MKMATSLIVPCAVGARRSSFVKIPAAAGKQLIGSYTVLIWSRLLQVSDSFLCSRPPRCFCKDCLEMLVRPGTFDKVKDIDPWKCYMCDPSQCEGNLKLRPDWRAKVQDFFANNTGMEFVRPTPTFAAVVQLLCTRFYTAYCRLVPFLILPAEPSLQEPHRVYPSIPSDQRRPIRVLSLFDGIATGLFMMMLLQYNPLHYSPLVLWRNLPQAPHLSPSPDLIQTLFLIQQAIWCSRIWGLRSNATSPQRFVRIPSPWGWWSTRGRSNTSTTFAPSRRNTWVEMRNHPQKLPQLPLICKFCRQLAEWGPFDLLIGGSPCNDLSMVNPLRKGLFGESGRLKRYF